MKVLVLGMDNTGKTTLCNYLKEKQEFKLINSCGPHKTKEQMEKFIYENLSKEGYLVFERFCYFDEMVYGKILRNESKFSFSDSITDFILNSGVTIIYCRPSIETIKNWQNREQMNGVIDKADELIERWDKVIRKARKLGFKVIKYDYKKHNVLDILGEL